MKDAHSAESHEKSILRFLFFELWLIVYTIVYTIYGDHPSGGVGAMPPTNFFIIQPKFQKWFMKDAKCAKTNKKSIF